jgi:hypothetical protein
MHRRKRRRDRVRNALWAIVAVALLGGVAWVGYQFYADFEDDEQRERERIRSELDADVGTGDVLRDAIDELETEPKFNGPGVPGLGVGEAP